MTGVVLITPAFAEAGTPSGLCTLALARAYAARGHVVRVLCGRTAAPRAGCECDGTITIHRLATRRGSPGEAFAAEAARAVHSLVRAGRCDVVVCVDGMSSLAGLVAMRSLLGLDAPIVSVSVEPDDAGTWNGARELSDATIQLSGDKSGGDGAESAFPIMPGIWTPPACDGPAFVACDALAPEQQSAIVDAYKASGASGAGWSLALLGGDGRWSILSGDGGGSAGHERLSVSITARTVAPVAAMHGLRDGHAGIAHADSAIALAGAALGEDLLFGGDRGTLAEAMGAASRLDPVELAGRARAAFGALSPTHDAGRIAAAHERLWEMPARVHSRVSGGRVWRSIERRLRSGAQRGSKGGSTNGVAH